MPSLEERAYWRGYWHGRRTVAHAPAPAAAGAAVAAGAAATETAVTAMTAGAAADGAAADGPGAVIAAFCASAGSWKHGRKRARDVRLFNDLQR